MAMHDCFFSFRFIFFGCVLAVVQSWSWACSSFNEWAAFFWLIGCISLSYFVICVQLGFGLPQLWVKNFLPYWSWKWVLISFFCAETTNAQLRTVSPALVTRPKLQTKWQSTYWIVSWRKYLPRSLILWSLWWATNFCKWLINLDKINIVFILLITDSRIQTATFLLVLPCHCRTILTIFSAVCGSMFIDLTHCFRSMRTSRNADNVDGFRTPAWWWIWDGNELSRGRFRWRLSKYNLFSNNAGWRDWTTKGFF